MARFTRTAPARPVSIASGPMRTAAPAPTYNGGAGWAKDARTELFSLAVTNMVGQAKFYESANDSDSRFVTLVRSAAVADPAWTAGFIGWLRNGAGMRTASVVAAAEYVRSSAPGGRQVVSSALRRADEPAEILGYWMSRYGRRLPAALKRGVADAVVRTYTPYAVLKYNPKTASMQMADVIRLTHPKPQGRAQSAVFRWLIDGRNERWFRKFPLLARYRQPIEALPLELREVVDFESVPAEKRRAHLRTYGLPKLVTWERLSGWITGGMDAEAWTAATERMPYFALLRNLRNFEAKGVDEPTLEKVAGVIGDPTAAAKSMVFPFQFWSAYRNSETVRFGWAIERGLNAATQNIPQLSGRTLVLVDISGSMSTAISKKSVVQYWEAGAVFAAAVERRSPGSVDVVVFGTKSKKVSPGTSALATISAIKAEVDANNGYYSTIGHGTEMWPAIARHFAGHDRIVVFTDGQINPTRGPMGDAYRCPIYVWDLAGYAVSPIELGANRHLLAGFSDKCFAMMQILESGKDAGWPWQIAAPVTAVEEEGDEA